MLYQNEPVTADVFREDIEKVILDNPTQGLVIEGLVWREMHNFSEDCVLLVLASEHFDESDYIRDYQEFLKEV